MVGLVHERRDTRKTERKLREISEEVLDEKPLCDDAGPTCTLDESLLPSTCGTGF